MEVPPAGSCGRAGLPLSLLPDGASGHPSLSPPTPADPRPMPHLLLATYWAAAWQLVRETTALLGPLRHCSRLDSALLRGGTFGSPIDTGSFLHGVLRVDASRDRVLKPRLAESEKSAVSRRGHSWGRSCGAEPAVAGVHPGGKRPGGRPAKWDTTVSEVGFSPPPPEASYFQILAFFFF